MLKASNGPKIILLQYRAWACKADCSELLRNSGLAAPAGCAGAHSKEGAARWNRGARGSERVRFRLVRMASGTVRLGEML